MAEDKKPSNERRQALLAEIDLLLDNEAGAEGARLLAEVEADPGAKALYEYSRALDLAAKNALPDVDPPEGMWARFEERLKLEPPPSMSLLDRFHLGMTGLVRLTRQRWVLTGSTFLFLITCGTLWWDGGSGYHPVRPPAVRMRPAGLALDRSLSDHLDEEALRALDDLMIDYHHEESLRGIVGGSADDPAKAGSQ